MNTSPPLDAGEQLRRAVPDLDQVTGALEERGHDAWLVGNPLLCVLSGRAVEPTHPLTIWTPAPADAIASTFDRATPLANDPRAWRVPTGARPIHVHSISGSIEHALAGMPFRVWALGFRPETNDLIGPGFADLSAGDLVEVGDPAEHARRDPLIVLRAAHLASCLDLSMEPAGVERLAAAVQALDRAQPAHRASELRAVLMGRFADRGVALLDAVGLRDAWLGADREAAPLRFDSLPPDFTLRLLAWLEGARPSVLLRRLRVDAGTRKRLTALFDHHPLEVLHPSLRPRAIRRLIERLGQEDVDALIAVRRLELASAAPNADTKDVRMRFDAFVEARTRFSSPASSGPALAVGGGDLILGLAIRAGPMIGRLLAALEGEVVAGRVPNEKHELIAAARRLLRD